MPTKCLLILSTLELLWSCLLTILDPSQILHNRQQTLARACSQRHVLPDFCALKLHHSASTERLSRLRLPPLVGTLEASGWMRSPHQEMGPSLLVQLGLASAAVLGEQRRGHVAPPETRTDMSVGMWKL